LTPDIQAQLRNLLPEIIECLELDELGVLAQGELRFAKNFQISAHTSMIVFE